MQASHPIFMLLFAQFATLTVLPEDVPEVLPITCAGRSAVLALRSQVLSKPLNAHSADMQNQGTRPWPMATFPLWR